MVLDVFLPLLPSPLQGQSCEVWRNKAESQLFNLVSDTDLLPMTMSNQTFKSKPIKVTSSSSNDNLPNAQIPVVMCLVTIQNNFSKDKTNVVLTVGPGVIFIGFNHIL